MANQKIHLAGEARLLEQLADASGIKPGMLVKLTATGCAVHATSVGFAERLFVQEDALQGRTVTDAYNSAAENVTATGDSSAKADMVQILAERPGNETLALLKAGTNYAIGTQLFSYGDGTLRATTGSPLQLIGVSLAALDLSASGAVNTLSPIRVA